MIRLSVIYLASTRRLDARFQENVHRNFPWLTNYTCVVFTISLPWSRASGIRYPIRGMISFVCNICGQSNSVMVLKHEESSCAGCGSNVRIRALVYLLATELFG